MFFRRHTRSLQVLVALASFDQGAICSTAILCGLSTPVHDAAGPYGLIGMAVDILGYLADYARQVLGDGERFGGGSRICVAGAAGKVAEGLRFDCSVLAEFGQCSEGTVGAPDVGRDQVSEQDLERGARRARP